MNIIDRFTRDRVSEVYWGTLAIVFLILFGLTFPGGTSAADRERDLAATRAIAATDDVIKPGLKLAPQAAPLSEPLDKATTDFLLVRVQAQILDDPRAESVRLWSTGGRLLFSTSSGDHVGSGGAINDAQISQAAAGSSSMQLATRTLAGDPLQGPLLRSYVPVSSDEGTVVAVAQIDQPDAAVLADVHRQWLTYRLGLALLAAFAIGLLVLSLREPLARIGAGVPFVPEMLPEGTSVLGDERATELEQAGARAKQRVAMMEERLLETEEARRQLEGDLQRALTQLATRPKRAEAEPERVRRQAAKPAAVAPPPPVRPDRLEPVVEVSEPGSVVDVTEPAAPEPEPEPVVLEPAPEPVALEPEPAPARRKRAPVEEPIVAAEEHASPETVFIPPKARVRKLEPVLEPESTEPEPVLEPEPTEPEPAELGASDDLVVLPDEDEDERFGDLVVVADAQEPNGAAAQNGETADGDESALEVLERLVEPVRSPGTPAPDVDLGDIRARLARTAARKKPGGNLEQGHASDPFEPGPPRR